METTSLDGTLKRLRYLGKVLEEGFDHPAVKRGYKAAAIYASIGLGLEFLDNYYHCPIFKSLSIICETCAVGYSPFTLTNQYKIGKRKQKDGFD